MKQYEILWVPVDRESSPKSTRIETACGTLDSIENSIVLTIEELTELWVAAQMRTLEIGRMAIREESGLPNAELYPDFKTHLTSKGITLP